MGARPCVGAVGVLADQVRSRRESLEVVRLESVIPVGRREMRMSIQPGIPPEGVPASIECVGCPFHDEPDLFTSIWGLADVIKRESDRSRIPFQVFVAFEIFVFFVVASAMYSRFRGSSRFAEDMPRLTAGDYT